MWRHTAGAALLWLCALPCAAAALQTPLEQSGYSRYSKTAEISAFLRALDQRSPQATMERIGTSAGGRPIEALWIAPDPSAPPAARLTVVLVGSQHGTEPSGGEALAALARELLEGALRPMTRDADFVLIPNANPDGRDLRRRVNGNGVNLSTDFVTLSQPETRALNDFLLHIRAEVILDIHESALLKKSTLGREGYLTDFEAQIEIANNPNVSPALRKLSLDKILPETIAGSQRRGLRASRYIGEITSIHQPIANGGLTLRNLRNKAGMMGMLSFLIENRLDPPSPAHTSHRNIRERTRKQLISTRAFLEAVLRSRAEIMRLTHQPPRQDQHLHVAYAPDPAHPRITLPLRRRDNGQLEQRRFADHRAVLRCGTLARPRAYLITDPPSALVEVLRQHRIAFRRVNPSFTQVAVAQIPTKAMTEPVKGCGAHGVHEKALRLRTHCRDLWIDMDQPQAALIPLLLDLRSTSSLFRQPGFDQLAMPGEEFFVYRLN